MSHTTSFSLSVAEKFDEILYNLNQNDQRLSPRQKACMSVPLAIVALPSITILALAETITSVALGALSTSAHLLTLGRIDCLREASITLIKRAAASINSIPHTIRAIYTRSNGSSTPPSINSSLTRGTALAAATDISSRMIPNLAQYKNNQYRLWLTRAMTSFENSIDPTKHEDQICLAMFKLILRRENITTFRSIPDTSLSHEILQEFNNCFAIAKRLCPTREELKSRFLDLNKLNNYLIEYTTNAIRNNTFELYDLRNNLIKNSTVEVDHNYTPKKNSFANPETIIRDLENGSSLINLLSLREDRFNIFNLIIEQSDMNATVQRLLQRISQQNTPITQEEIIGIILEQDYSTEAISPHAEKWNTLPNLRTLLQIPAGARASQRNYNEQLSTFTKTAFRSAYRHFPEFFHDLDRIDPATGSPIMSNHQLSEKQQSGKESLSSLFGPVFQKLALCEAYFEIKHGNIALNFIPNNRLESIANSLGAEDLTKVKEKLAKLSEREENIFLLKLFSSTDSLSFFEELSEGKQQIINQLIKNTHDIASDLYQPPKVRPGYQRYPFNTAAIKANFNSALQEVLREAEFA